MRSLAWDAVFARRLARHHLITPAPRARLVDVVSEICGIHAQVMPSAELSIGLRIRGFTARDVEAALWERRDVVKTYGVRGTVNLFPAREYGWWLAALRATRTAREMADGVDPERTARFGYTVTQFLQVSEAIAEAVEGRQLTRDELGEELTRRLGRWATRRSVEAFGGQKWPAWQAALGHAAREGLLCFGPDRGPRVTYVRPKDWIGLITKVEPRTAIRELFVRYLRAYGPASERDFAQWLAITPARARALRREAGDAVEEVDVAGTPMLQVRGDRPTRAAPATTLLLPRFDVYTVGSYPRDVVAPPATIARAAATGLFPKARVGSGRAYLFGPMPVLVLDGVVSGIWESKRTAKRVSIRVQPLVKLHRSRRAALEDAAARIGNIVGVESELAVGTITTRPHL